MQTNHPDWTEGIIQVVTNVNNRDVYDRLKETLNFFGFITNLSIYNYDGKGSVSSPYLKENNFIIASGEADGDAMKQALAGCKSASDRTPNIQTIILQPGTNFDKNFYIYFLNKLEPPFNGEGFQNLLSIRLQMLRDKGDPYKKPDYAVYRSMIMEIDFESPCKYYAYFKTQLEDIEENGGGEKQYEALASQMLNYLDESGGTHVKAEFLLGQILDFGLRNYSQAVKAYTGVLKYITANANFYYFLAAAYLKLKNALSYENEIVSNLTKAIQYDKFSYRAYFKFTRLYDMKGDYPRMLEYLRRVIELLEPVKESYGLTGEEEEFYGCSVRKYNRLLITS